MADFERRERRVTCYGRLKDELTREVIPVGGFEASIAGAEAALYKTDGSFVFCDLMAPPAVREIQLSGPIYRARTVSQTLPAATPLELAFEGEDELYVVVKTINAGTGRVTFDPIQFLPTIPQGARVFGEGGFSTTLSAALEGESVTSATLGTVTALAANTVLRVERSRHLVLRPGAEYPFSPDQTVIAVTVVADADGRPIRSALTTIDHVNGVAPANVTVGTLQLRVATFGTQRSVLGPLDAITTAADARGRSILYFPSGLPITQLQLSVSNPGYVTTTVTTPVTAATRTSLVVRLLAI